ncbi:hypothetical protein C8R42DRAFT_649083 [Lentinula raphanica]|nr:hypothetical protein C8R42DRAFT_649083 [Lentinula raphanica]
MATHNPITFTEKQRAGIGLLESQGWVALKDGELRVIRKNILWSTSKISGLLGGVSRVFGAEVFFLMVYHPRGNHCPAFATLSCEAALEATSIRANHSLFEYLLPWKCEDQPSYTLVLSSPYVCYRKFVILRPKTRWNERWESLREVVRGSKKTEEKVVDSPVNVDARQMGKWKYQKKKCHDKSKAKL